MKYDVMIYLLVEASADRIFARLLRDKFALEPRSSDGRYVIGRGVSRILSMWVTPFAKDERFSNVSEVANHIIALMKELNIPYFGGEVRSEDAPFGGFILTGFMPGISAKPKKPKDPLANVLPFPKSSDKKEEHDPS